MAPIPPKTAKRLTQLETGSRLITTDEVVDDLGRPLSRLLKKENNKESQDVTEISQEVTLISEAVLSIQNTVNSIASTVGLMANRISSLEVRVAALEQQSSSTFDEVWTAFQTTINSKMAGTVSPTGATYTYLKGMYDYADVYAPQFYDPDLFELVVSQGGTLINNTARAKKAQTAWLMAMCLAEICPNIQNDLYDTGYGFVGSADSQAVYGYQFTSDVNIARMIASVMYSMHRPDAATQEAAARSELATADTGNALGTTRGSTIPTHSEETLAAVADGTQFMPSTPLNSNSNPDFAFDESTYTWVKANYTYSGGAYSNSRAEQAVLDSGRTDVASQMAMYTALGLVISTAQQNLITPGYKWGSRIATPMKDGFDSVSQTTYPGYASNPRTDAEFRMRPFEYHSDHLLDPNDAGASYLNTSSYPSGHTSFGWNIALMLIETHRNSVSDVKKIIARAFQFGQSRVIGRYHWQADVIHGYVIGTCCIPRLHSYNEYITLLSAT